ncbi:MAG: DUF6979 family protein [Leptospirillum sp.]
MGIFAQTAIRAVKLLKQGISRSPRDVWDEAVLDFSKSTSSRDKGCPRDTFLGVWEISLKNRLTLK